MTFSWNHLSAQAHPSGTILEQYLAPIWVYDLGENPLYSSPCGLQLLQIPPSAQSRAVLDINDFVLSSDRHLDVELKQRLLNQEIATYTVEKRLVTHTEELLWVNFNVSRLEFAEPHSPAATYFVIRLEDITEQRKLYDALIRTEEKWKTFVLNSAHLFLQTSNVGRILYVSPAVERILGYPEAELLDCSIAELIHTQDLEEFKVTFQQWVSGSALPQPHLECRWRTRSGQWMYLYLQGQRFPLALNIEGVAISGYNISDRKHLEVALAASERKLKSLTTNGSWPVMKSLPSPFRDN
jgi:PAS domain S-box-containing protein